MAVALQTLTVKVRVLDLKETRSLLRAAAREIARLQKIVSQSRRKG